MISQIETTAATQEETFVIQKNLRIAAFPGAFARLRFEVDVAGVMTNLVISVEKIR